MFRCPNLKQQGSRSEVIIGNYKTAMEGGASAKRIVQKTLRLLQANNVKQSTLVSCKLQAGFVDLFMYISVFKTLV